MLERQRQADAIERMDRDLDDLLVSLVRFIADREQDVASLPWR
jgi:hypothetical protein